MASATRFLKVVAYALLLTLVLAGLVPTVPVKAQEMTIGISGNFSDQVYEIPQGGSVRGLDTKIVVFNGNPEDITVTMVDDAPPGVTIDLSPREFVIPAASGQMPTYQEVAVGVRVSADAPPMAYTITVTAHPSRVVQGGVVPLPAANVSAPLMVLGESATVVVDTVSPREEPVVSDIRLFRIVGSERYEYNYSQTGHLQTLVSPGRYEALAYVGGVELARDGFDVPVNQEVRRTLIVETIYFRSFQVLPATNTKTEELGWVQIVYTITNVYQPVADAEVRLVVTRNGEFLQELPILFLGLLEKGDIGVPYQYSPPGGWEDGTYGFKLQLYVGGNLYAETNEQTLEAGVAAKKSSLWILFLILGILGTAGLGFLIFFLLKRRKKDEKKSAKAEKKKRKKKEETPAPKVEEPVRKPEPVRREPPVRKAEPIEESAPLSSISSLKARMASLERDQAGGPDDDEEPDADEKGVSSPPEEAEKDVSGKTEARIQKSPVVEKPIAAAKASAAEKQHLPKPSGPTKAATEQGPVPADSEIKINWPPKSVGPEQAAEGQPPAPAKSDSDVQTNWTPKPTSSFAEAARLRLEAQQKASEATEEGEDKASAPETAEEPANAEDSADKPAQRSSFAEAARRRMQARQQDGEDKDSGTKPEEPEP